MLIITGKNGQNPVSILLKSISDCYRPTEFLAGFIGPTGFKQNASWDLSREGIYTVDADDHDSLQHRTPRLNNITEWRLYDFMSKQEIRFIGNTLWNKCCRYNEGSLYKSYCLIKRPLKS